MDAMDGHRLSGWFGWIVGTCLVALAFVWAGHGIPYSAAAPATSGSCSKAKSRVAMESFIKAFNRGDAETLDSLFAREPAFEWYSSPAPGRRLNRASFKRSTLLPYFVSRHSDGDRMHLRRFDFIGRGPKNSGIGFQVARRADGFRGGKWFRASSKAAVICSGGPAQFIVISLGGVPPTS